MKYYAYLLHPTNLHVLTPMHVNGTWNEAFKLCQSVGGYLPIIRSRDEQDKIIALLGSSYCPPIKLLFIGLLLNEVRNLLYLIDNIIMKYKVTPFSFIGLHYTNLIFSVAIAKRHGDI